MSTIVIGGQTMTDPAAHMQHPDVVAAEAAWTEHVEGCRQCQDASDERAACQVGRDLHEATVLAAHKVYREAGGG